MGVGEILDVAIRVYKSNWKTLMAIVAVIVVPFTLLQNLAVHSVAHSFVLNGQSFVPRANYTDYQVVLFVFLGLNYLLIVPFLRGAVARAVGEIYLGERPSAKASLWFAASKLGSLLLGLLLSTLIIALGLLALAIPGIIFFIRYTFVTPAIVVEGQSGGASLKRSWALAKGNGWRIFGTLFVASIITGIVSAILVVPASLVTLSGGGGSAGWVIRAAAASIASVIATPFAITVAVLLYFDSRIRNEAFDLSVMAREVGQNPS
jgi:hypothetical protein